MYNFDQTDQMWSWKFLSFSSQNIHNFYVNSPGENRSVGNCAVYHLDSIKAVQQLR